MYILMYEFKRAEQVKKFHKRTLSPLLFLLLLLSSLESHQWSSLGGKMQKNSLIDIKECQEQGMSSFFVSALSKVIHSKLGVANKGLFKWKVLRFKKEWVE